MSSQKHIQDELRSLGSSLPLNKNLPFSVPEGYFESLAASILAKVKSIDDSVQEELEQLSPLLAGIPKRTPYSVPSSYFEAVIDVAAIQNPETTSPVLAAIGKSMPYTVPQGYFESVLDQVLAKVSKPAKVVPLFDRTWMRVAAAAAVIGALFFGGYQLLSGNDGGKPGLAGQLPADTAQQQVASNQPFRKEIKQVSTEELQDFIETVEVKAAPKASNQSKKGDKGAENLLKDVSTSEMESFLATMPTIDDDLLITD